MYIYIYIQCIWAPCEENMAYNQRLLLRLWVFEQILSHSVSLRPYSRTGESKTKWALP